MRPLFSLLILSTILLVSCAQRSPGPLPTTSPPSTTAAPTLAPPRTSAPRTNVPRTSPPPTPTAVGPTMPSPTLPPPTPTGGQPAGLPPASAFTVQQGAPLPPNRPLIAFEAGVAPNQTLLLADPADCTIYEFSFPAEAHFAAPFLAGLSPDTRYFVYFTGGQLETLYEVEHLRLSAPDLMLHVQDLSSGEVIFSTPLLSPSFPRDLEPVAETIKDEWSFTFQNSTFEQVVAATQEMLLDYIRKVAWSPDSSLLAYASQDPGPTSDLYFFSPESGSVQRVTDDPGHVLKSVWAPDSSVLIMETSLYDRHAREDTTYLLSRDGTLRGSFTSQIWYFVKWHDSTLAFLYGATDSADYFELKTLSAADGTVSMLWEGSWGNIAFTPDLSMFLLSSFMPSAPEPPHPGLYLGKTDDGSLITLSETIGWGVAYWGSERFAFAASSRDGGTVGINLNGESVKLDEGYWKFAPSPDGSYLAGYNMPRHGYLPGVLPGLRVFDGSGELLESIDDALVACAVWDAASTALVYQVESRLYLWDAASGATRLVSDQLDGEECGFKWVRARE